ncbi:uncharacterized protein LOC5514666 [Nematostella vectensis]|uniref:uncharacterized protein LOC5514666 n=1 Tax=Nematostella vectensis TaxID=45351 RepID=UPI0020774B32|nr:uncharacterized protein LOC5514666 [Nematostella vectensis]
MQNQGFESSESEFLRRQDDISRKDKDRLYKTNFFSSRRGNAQGKENRGLVLSPGHSTSSLSSESERDHKDRKPRVDDESGWVCVPNLGVRHSRLELLTALNNYSDNVVCLRRLYFQQAMNQIEVMVNHVLDKVQRTDQGLAFRHMSPSCFYEIKSHNEIDVFLVLTSLSPDDVIIEEVEEPLGYARVKMITSSAMEDVESIYDSEVSVPASLIHAMTSPESFPMTSSMTTLMMSSPTVLSEERQRQASNLLRTSSLTPVITSQEDTVTSAAHHKDNSEPGLLANYVTSCEEDVYLSAKRISRRFATLVNKAHVDVLRANSVVLPQTHEVTLDFGMNNESNNRVHSKTKQKKKVSFKKRSPVPEALNSPTMTSPHVAMTTPYVINLIPTIECPRLWPKCASWLKTCSRRWPSEKLKRKIVTQGIHLAALPPSKNSDLWQIKFLNGQRALIHHEGNEAKAKCLRIVKVLCEVDLSYPKAIRPQYLENILMWASRKYWSDSDWTEANLPARFLDLMAGLHKCMKNGDCHDFFLPSVNLLDELGNADLSVLSAKIMDVLVQPLKYLEI